MPRTTFHAQWKFIAATFAVMAASVPGLVAGPVAHAASQALEGAQFSGTLATAGCNTTTGSQVVTVTWGDGQTSSGSFGADDPTTGQTPVNGSHRYAEEGDYSGTVQYTDDCGSHSPAFQIHVADGTLSGSGAAISATAGGTFSGVVAHFSDADPNGTTADYTATIGWGDGSSSPGSVQPSGAGFDVSGSHTYGSAGSYVLSVVITDAGGATTNASGTASAASPTSTTTSASTTTTTTGTPNPPGATAPRAAFTIAPSAGPDAPLTLDASRTHAPGTIPVRTYSWRISGAHTASTTCGGGTSKLSLFLPHGGSATISLTVSDLSGNTSQVQQSTSLSGLRYQPKFHVPRGVLDTVTPIAWCIPGLNDPPVDVSSNGGPPKGCNQTLNLFIVEAVGCFTEITTGKDIPAAEAAILDQQPQWAASGAHAIDASTARASHAVGARATRFNPAGVARLSGAALAYFARPFISRSEVRLNGVDYIPHNGASILIVPMLNLVISSDATIALGDIPLGNGQIAEDVGDTHGQGYQVNANDYRVHVDDYQLSTFAKKIGVAGLPFDGRASLDFSFHRALLSASVTMPNFFAADSGGDPFNASIVLHADNQSSLQLDQIHLGPVNADVFGLGFTDVKFDYDAQTESWNAQGKLDLFGTVGIDATPDPPNPPEYGVHFGHGAFQSAGAAADFGDAGIEIFPGVQLNRIGVAVGLNPTLFIGTVGLRMLELAQIDGKVIVALPSDAAPYTLTTGDAGPQFAQIAGRTFTGSPTIGVGGSLALQIAGVNVPLANAYVLYSYPSYVAFGGGFQYGADDFGINGGVNGEFNVAANQFNVEGHVQINMPDPLPGFSGDAVVSTKGIAACGHGVIYTPFPIGVTLGAGYHWGDGIVLWIRNCNIGEFRQQVQTNAARAASTSRSFTLAPRLPSAEVRIEGDVGAPTVTVGAPDGQTATTGTLAPQGRFMVVRTPKLNATWIEIDHPVPGTYTIDTTPGSPAIASLATADGLAPASVTGRVSGGGERRVLHYRVHPRPGQQVTFLEGSHRILTINGGGHGSVPFRPSGGSLGTRTVLAQVSLAGLPNANLAVTRFTVRRLPPLHLVRGLQVRRQGRVLRITFRAVPSADRYVIYVHGTDGQVHTRTISSSQHGVGVIGIARTASGLVTVTALRARDRGPRATAGFRALGRLRTGVHPIGRGHR